MRVGGPGVPAQPAARHVPTTRTLMQCELLRAEDHPDG